jgi:hypothetical protein
VPCRGDRDPHSWNMNKIEVKYYCLLKKSSKIYNECI